MHVNLSTIPFKMIVASNPFGGIGYQDRLPWSHHAKDMKHFQEVTKDAVLLMGRKTYEEIKELKDKRGSKSTELLPGRKSVVLSSQGGTFTNEEIIVESSLETAVELHFDKSRDLFVIGGLQLYTDLLPYVTEIHWTMFKDEDIKCDKHLPIRYINQHFTIVDGKEEEDLYFLRCQRLRM